MDKRGRSAENEMGKIFVRGVGRGVEYLQQEDVINIPAWSRGASPWSDLSPFKIGPVIFDEDGVRKECATVETWWQSFKVWSVVVMEMEARSTHG